MEKTTVRCTCGEVNKDGALFCNRCGKRLEQKAGTNACPHCGRENTSYSEYCSWCGSELHQHPETDDSEDDFRDDSGDNWSKTYGIPGLYEEEVSVASGDAQVQTRASLFGVHQVTTFPRWMVGLPTIIMVPLMLILGGMVTYDASRAGDTEGVYFGLGVIAVGLLTGLIVYMLYYHRP